MNASLRSTGKYGGSATWPSWPALVEVEVAEERAVEQLGEERRLAVLERQAEGLEIPAVLAVPGRGQRPEGLADLVGRQVAEGQDQLAADARRRGRRPAAAASSRCARRGGRLLGLGVLVLDLAVLADVAAEDPDGLLADPRVAVR